MPMHLTPLTPTIGAEITGLDIGRDADAAADELRAAFREHLVLVFRGQHLTREQHKAFGRLFGELHVHPSRRSGMAGSAGKGDPEIFTVSAGPESRHANGEAWHSDVSCEEDPPLASILHLTEAPAQGGDTLFMNMTGVFESLSAPLRSLLTGGSGLAGGSGPSGLTARHDGARDLANYGITLRADQHYPSAVHPVVIAHPQTGKPVLFVNDSFTTAIEGLPRWESDMLLHGLYAHAARSVRWQCRVRWQPGTLVMWDNRAVQHHAVWDYFPARRRGDRVSVVGAGRPLAWRPPTT